MRSMNKKLKPNPEVKALIERVVDYANRVGITEKTASGRIFNDGKRLGALRKGSRMWPDTLKESNAILDRLEADWEQANAA